MFASAETVQLAIVGMVNGAIVTVLGIIYLVVKEWLDEKRANRIAVKLDASDQKIASKLEKSDTVQADQIGGLADKLDSNTSTINEKLGTIHTLVNSERGTLLHTYAITARAKYEVTKKNEDLSAAEEAEKMYREHVEAQAAVDQKDKSRGVGF